MSLVFCKDHSGYRKEYVLKGTQIEKKDQLEGYFSNGTNEN